MNRTLYAAHRWLSLLAFAQLAVWTLTGSFFAFVPRAWVHGEAAHGAGEAELDDPAVLALSTVYALTAAPVGGVTRIELRPTPGGLFFVVRGKQRGLRLDARSGAVSPVTPAEAEATARRDQPGEPRVRSTTLVTEAPIEYRAHPVPAFRVALDDAAGTVVYVDALTGEVTARRNDVWRVYDFLWSLHILDYGAREDFHHPLMYLAASLALLTVASGAVLWALRLGRWIARKRGA